MHTEFDDVLPSKYGAYDLDVTEDVGRSVQEIYMNDRKEEAEDAFRRVTAAIDHRLTILRSNLVEEARQQLKGCLHCPDFQDTADRLLSDAYALNAVPFKNL